MSDLEMARSKPEELLWKNLEAVHAGMLGIESSHQHMQPMAHFTDHAGRRLWFLTKRDTHLFQDLNGSARAHFCLISKDQDFHACLMGDLAERDDPAMLDRVWGPTAKAWFTGKDDPNLALLEFKLRDAAIWASTGSSIVYAWETVKAGLTGGTPDVGVHNEIAFA